MFPTNEGSIRLFRLWGVNVFLHWSWFVIAYLEVEWRGRAFSSPIYNIIEYLALFGIVLMHEFGHAMACRQVGGQADRIVLWPLGGVAYVAPPQRPGAQLWSIAAGPLVNVVLIPILFVIGILQAQSGVGGSDLRTLLGMLLTINIVLLIFNLLPIFPLDGGQILRSLLWFKFGRGKSLKIATIIGFIGVAGLAVYAFQMRSIWMGIMTAFIFMNCRQGWEQAKAINQMESLPRRSGFRCPACNNKPLKGEFWPCPRCRTTFDAFATEGQCPNCRGILAEVQCADCGRMHPVEDWVPTRDQ